MVKTENAKRIPNLGPESGTPCPAIRKVSFWDIKSRKPRKLTVASRMHAASRSSGAKAAKSTVATSSAGKSSGLAPRVHASVWYCAMISLVSVHLAESYQHKKGKTQTLNMADLQSTRNHGLRHPFNFGNSEIYVDPIEQVPGIQGNPRRTPDSYVRDVLAPRPLS